MLLSNFDGLDHETKDIKRKWEGTYFLGTDLKSNKRGVMYIANIDQNTGICKWNFTTELNNNLNYVTEIEINHEFPKTGVVRYKKDIWLVTKAIHRQWTRGCNANTIDAECLTRQLPNKSNFSLVLNAAFSAQNISFDNAIAILKANPDQCVESIDRSFWLNYNDGFLFKLMYEDIFLGFVSEDRAFISVSENVTLAEEAINDFQLRNT